jgi:hypothetical protein
VGFGALRVGVPLFGALGEQAAGSVAANALAAKVIEHHVVAELGGQVVDGWAAVHAGAEAFGYQMGQRDHARRRRARRHVTKTFRRKFVEVLHEWASDTSAPNHPRAQTKSFALLTLQINHFRRVFPVFATLFRDIQNGGDRPGRARAAKN